MSKDTRCGNERWAIPFPSPHKSDPPKAESRRKLSGEALFVHECRKAFRNLPCVHWLFSASNGTESGSSCGLRFRSSRLGWLMEEVRLHWALGSGFLNNAEFSFTRRLAGNALPLFDLNYKGGLVDMPGFPRCSSGLEETAVFGVMWMARNEPKQIVQLDVGYVVDNVLPRFQGEKRLVFLTI